MKAKIYSLTLGLFLGLCVATFAQNSGDLDPSFGTDGIVISGTTSNPIEAFQDLAIQEDQKIIAAGMGWDANYTARVRVARYMTDGTLDTDFGVDGYFTFEQDNEALIYSCTINSEGKIILAGATTNYQFYKVLLIQLNSDGTLDTSFGDNGVVIQQFSAVPEYFEDFARGVALDANENILISGSSFTINPDNQEYLRQPLVARFTADGTLDTSFGVNGMATLPVVQDGNSFDCVLVQPDGKILTGGTYSPEFLWNVMLLARYNEDGSLDSTFGQEGVIQYSQNNVDDEIWNMALTSEGDIIVGGFTATASYDYYAILVKFTTDGVLDTSFGSDGTVIENEETFNEGADLQIQDDEKIVFGGSTGEGPPGSFDMAVWKYNADGSRDVSFGNNGLSKPGVTGSNVFLNAIALQANGQIVGVGQSRDDSNDIQYLVMRMDNDIVNGIDDSYYAKAPTLSPNPALRSDQLNIQFSEDLTANATLEFYSITGKLLHSTPINNELIGGSSLTTNIPGNISSGIYLVSISQNGVQRAATKLVIID